MEIKKEELPTIDIETPLENVGGTPMPTQGVVSSTLDLPRGRPSLYTPELAHEICSRMSSGESLRKICRDDDMPDHSTVISWALDDKEGFYNQYARAREIQAEHMFEEILEISDQSDNVVTGGNEKKSSAYAQNQRLKVDTRKWYLSKVLPKKFGDRMDHTTNGKDLPTPIMQLNVQSNNSNEQNSITE